MSDCLICNRIQQIKEGKNRYFVKELPSGYVVIGDHQYYHGYTLLLSKIHKNELHKLGKKTRLQYLKDMGTISEAVYKAFKPKKLNYELLGNTDEHLHWHIFPRYSDDPKPDVPIWMIDRTVRSAKKTIPSDNKLKIMKNKLLKELNKLSK